jgi:hypothetical protein
VMPYAHPPWSFGKPERILSVSLDKGLERLSRS